jgi:hypothetical protein
MAANEVVGLKFGNLPLSLDFLAVIHRRVPGRRDVMQDKTMPPFYYSEISPLLHER